MFSLIYGWVNNGEAGDLRRHRAHYDVTVIKKILDGLHKLIFIKQGNHDGCLISAIYARFIHSVSIYMRYSVKISIEFMKWGVEVGVFRDIQVKNMAAHDDVIKWKHFPRYWPFVRGIHRSPVNSPHKGQWRGALMFSLICVSINGWVNNMEAGDSRRYRAPYDVIIMWWLDPLFHQAIGSLGID